MTTIAQHYKVIGNGSAVTPDMEPGMFVYSSDNTSVIGFIYDVSDYTADIVMFEPLETTDTTRVIVIAEVLSINDMFNKLRQALKKNPRMMPIWSEHFGMPDITED